VTCRRSAGTLRTPTTYRLPATAVECPRYPGHRRWMRPKLQDASRVPPCLEPGRARRGTYTAVSVSGAVAPFVGLWGFPSLPARTASWPFRPYDQVRPVSLTQTWTYCSAAKDVCTSLLEQFPGRLQTPLVKAITRTLARFGATWDPARKSPEFRLRGCHPLCRRFPDVFGYSDDFLLPARSAALAGRSHNPGHATPAGCDTRPVWPVPLSLTTTQGIAVAFSSCGY